MTYRATCPRCGSVFRLGEDQLKAADGWAQCGVCGANFDTHLTLLNEDGSPLPATPAAASPRVATAEQSAAVSAPPPVAKPVEDEGAAQAPSHDAHGEARLPSIILIDPDVPAPEDFGPLPQISTPPGSHAELPQARGAATQVPAAQIEYPDAGHGRLDDEDDEAYDALPAVLPRRRTWVWALISLILLTVLAAQLAYFLRDPLVNQLPQTRPALEKMCAALGCTLSLPKRLALLQIVGSDLETEADGQLTLSLTLGNRAPHAQAWPVLVLTLSDERNRPLARRSFAPSEYLGDTRRIAAGMPPRSEQALRLALTVRDLKPMGFDLQLVY